MRTAITILIALSTAIAVSAQDAVFTVLAAKGSALAQRANNPDDYAALKTGVDIMNGDKIIISGSKTYVGLVDNDGNTVELKKSGVYNAEELSKALEMSEGSLAQKYIDFLVKDMTKESEQAAHNMSVAGAVDRSTENTQIKLFLPESVEALTGKAAVKWMKNDNCESYHVVVSNMFDETILSEKVNSNFAELNFSPDKVSPGDVLKIKVTDGDDTSITSQVATIHFVKSDKNEKAKEETEMLKSKSEENSAIGHVVLGSYYKKHGYYMNALNHFHTAKTIEPEVEAYEKMYNSLLYQMGM